MNKHTCNRRLRLRALEPDDLNLLYEAENDMSGWRDSDITAPFSHSLLADYIATTRSDPFTEGQLRLVAVGDDDTPIGLADFYDISLQHSRAFTGIYICKSVRNKGYGAEMLSLMEEYASTALMLGQLAAKVVSDNTLSVRLYTHAGWHHAGTLLSWHRSMGRIHDVEIFQKIL